MTQEEFNNLGVGKTFALGCRKFRVVEADEYDICVGCHFDENNTYCGCGDLQAEEFLPECFGNNRKDKKNVIFKEVENND